MDATIAVCDRCGSKACLDTGRPTCAYDGVARGETSIPLVKYERSEGAAPPFPKPSAMPGRRRSA